MCVCKHTCEIFLFFNKESPITYLVASTAAGAVCVCVCVCVCRAHYVCRACVCASGCVCLCVRVVCVREHRRVSSVCVSCASSVSCVRMWVCVGVHEYTYLGEFFVLQHGVTGHTNYYRFSGKHRRSSEHQQMTRMKIFAN